MSKKKNKRYSRSQLNRKKKDELVAALLETYSILDKKEVQSDKTGNKQNTSQTELIPDALADASKSSANVTEVLASKALLRIDLYPHQSQYRGKIEHILSGDKLVFTPEDKKAVFDFFDKHQPLINEDQEGPAPSVSPNKTKKKEGEGLLTQELALLTATPSEGSSTQAKKFGVFYTAMKPLTNRLMHGELFNAHLTLDLATLPADFGEKINYRVEIYAKRIGDHKNYLLTQANGSTMRSEALNIETPAMKLPTGRYRLETMVILTAVHGTQLNRMHEFSENNLIYIH